MGFLWVGGGRWDIILSGGGGVVGDGWRWVGVSGGWVQCLIMPIIFEEFQGLLLTN